jgi:hypothetical protein
MMIHFLWLKRFACTLLTSAPARIPISSPVLINPSATVILTSTLKLIRIALPDLLLLTLLLHPISTLKNTPRVTAASSQTV